MEEGSPTPYNLRADSPEFDSGMNESVPESVFVIPGGGGLSSLDSSYIERNGSSLSTLPFHIAIHALLG